MRTTASWWTSFDTYGALTGIGPRSTVWIPGPLTATMNLFAAVHARACGAGLALGTDFDGATHGVLTPAQLTTWGDRLPAGLRVVVAGDRLAPQMAARAGEMGLEVSHYYGASELSFVAWGTHAEDLRPFPGVEVESRSGELWSRSPFHAEGYGRSGWASVGDRGSVEREPGGLRVRVEGRGEEALTTAGATVLTNDVERVLGGVARGRLAVIGLPHERFGQVVAAVLEDPQDWFDLRGAAQDGLVEAARPRVWLAGPSPWPTTGGGETDRAGLREAAQTGELRRLTTQGAPPPDVS